MNVMSRDSEVSVTHSVTCSKVGVTVGVASSNISEVALVGVWSRASRIDSV